MTVDVEIDVDRVVICRQVVRRPDGVSPSQWLDYWTGHREEEVEKAWHQGFEAGYRDGVNSRGEES